MKQIRVAEGVYKRTSASGRTSYKATAPWWVDASGKRHQPSRTFGILRDAKAWRAEQLGRRVQGVNLPSERVTIASFMAEWEAAKAARLRPTTRKAYEIFIRVHIVPGLGTAQLADLTPAMVNRFYRSLMEKGLSPKSVRNVHAILRRALEDAVRWGRVARNVAAHADAPSLSAASTPEMNTWSTEQLARFLEHSRKHRLHALFVLAGTTGARRGELLGLRWKDVDLEAGTITIRRTAVTVDGTVLFNDPKTSNGRRTIALHAGAVSALRSHRKLQAAEKLAWPVYEDDGLLFARETGEPTRGDVVTRAFDRLTTASGLPRIRFHDLRHSHVAHLIEANVHVQTICKRIGHASPAFTLTRYGHLMPGMDEHAAGIVGDAIFAG